MRKVFAGFFLAIFLFFIGGFVFGECQYGSPPKTCPDCSEPGGLVPCGRNCDDPNTSGCECEPCQLCHLFVMLDNWTDFLLLGIVPILAALMIAIGGGMYIVSQGNPEMLGRVKKLFTAVVIGLIIIYGAWLIVNTFLTIIGVEEWTGLKTWWEIPCP